MYFYVTTYEMNSESLSDPTEREMYQTGLFSVAAWLCLKLYFTMFNSSFPHRKTKVRQEVKPKHKWSFEIHTHVDRMES